MFNTLLIANRGEISVRIIRAARELGIRSVQAFSEADRDSQAVNYADEAICIGPPAAAKSYLNIEGIINAAKAVNADAIHPGYGFLSENPLFAAAVESAGLIFIGPKSETIALMGNKIAARQVAKEADIPIVPGSAGKIDDLQTAQLFAEKLGFPVMVKAAAGGGGKGIRQISRLDELENYLPHAQREASSAFGDSSLFIEKAITNSRHIEVQVVGDGKNAVHFFERDCSLQRKKQKLWEEAPAPDIPEELRARMCAATIALVSSLGYRGVGTVEYIYEPESESFFFMEMNTRIQVEHPVTEVITGVDLVRLGLLIAGGSTLEMRQEDISMRGHAIEVRINAEDPTRDFFPSPGQVTTLQVPDGPGIRFDSMLYQGYEIPPYYDSLIGKLIVFDEDRKKTILRLKRALGELHIDGIKTTTDLFRLLVQDKQIQKGPVNTLWLEQWIEANDFD
jgi:acetyl-CoA carboxylase biotin carboxylase subunit